MQCANCQEIDGQVTDSNPVSTTNIQVSGYDWYHEYLTHFNKPQRQLAQGLSAHVTIKTMTATKEYH